MNKLKTNTKAKESKHHVPVERWYSYKLKTNTKAGVDVTARFLFSLVVGNELKIGAPTLLCRNVRKEVVTH